jgi:N-acetyl-gamma-glutamylphosphate reductase
MPPLIFLAVVGAAGYAGFKLFSKLIEKAQTPSRSETERVRREARAATGTTRDLGELEWDEKAGVYKPSGDKKA